ncbi:hypothetical protein [Calycomorphotria hydatis]|uniref:SGNH hydrolase-type esterase domain-containing protein n=1 Tax=Calycomorphotria hydatis TaxID=2528027 RepID=A0A517TD06_9PLAN|nr:hypothetical protein [Calycomorphotria hydatis]QDT66263.1 hypothetical protein V22_35280 [Calycomorphotria hydatis]
MFKRIFHTTYSLISAVVLLVALLVVGEVSLRVISVYQPSWLGTQLPEQSLTVGCPRTYRALVPHSDYQVENPDNSNVARIQINSFGIRGAEPQLPKPTGQYRVLLLGDETFFGAYLTDEETVSSRLTGYLNHLSPVPIEVISGAVPGDCPLLSYLRLRSSLLALQPDLIVLNIDPSDLEDDRQCRRWAQVGRDGVPLSCRAEGFQSSAAKSVFNDFLLPRVVMEQAQQYLASMQGSGETKEKTDAEQRLENLSAPLSDEDLLLMRRMLEPVQYLHQLAEGTYTQLVLTTSPQPWQVDAEMASESEQDIKGREFFNFVQQYSQKENLPFLNLSEPIHRYPKKSELFLTRQRDLSTEGAEYYAQHLAKYLLQKYAHVWHISPQDLRKLQGLAGETPGHERAASEITGNRETSLR